MGVKKTPGPGPKPMPLNPVPIAGIRRSKAGSVRRPGVDEPAAEPPLPPPSSSIRGKSSPLSGVIAEGLAQLSRAEGWEAQTSALDVLASAMMRSGRRASSGDLQADPMSEMAFSSILARHATLSDRSAVKEDARQLARLAVVALGADGLSDKRRPERTKQLESDLAEVRGALADVLARPEGERTAQLKRVVSDIEWVAGVLARSKRTREAQPRVDAVAGMLKILLRYAGQHPV